MPLYECHCGRCDLTFEVLAAVSDAAGAHPCPQCGRRARRILSAVTFGRSGREPEARAADPSRPDVTRLRVPPPAQLCWMDERSTSRYAAHLHGRGAEYDETVAAREETRKQRGEPVPAVSAHGHSHSPLADPVVYARRRAAAKRAEKPAPAK
ncbi:MAG TPA: zinc ribbon domain-containing protein [Candidatus Binataceae bacterium]|nr:zinc ribbon domain-containing protein [Candidatus Binataceae bacterium]